MRILGGKFDPSNLVLPFPMSLIMKLPANPMRKLPASDIRGSGNVHPTDKGYADMADLWYGVIKGYLPN